MVNGPLMKLMYKRFAWIYWFLLAFLLVGWGAILFFSVDAMPMHFEKHPFFSMGLFLALIWGAGIFTREFRQGGLMEFVMARPVSRGEFFNTVLLSAVIPMLVLMFMPVIYVITLYPWFDFTLPLYRLLLMCLIAAAWVVVILLLGINIGLFAAAHSSRRYGRAVSTFILAMLVAVFINMNNIILQPGPANPGWIALYHPLPALAAALPAAGLLYCLGRRRVDRMDI